MYRKTEPQLYISKKKKNRYRAYILRFYWRTFNIFFLHLNKTKNKRYIDSLDRRTIPHFIQLIQIIFRSVKWWFQKSMSNFYVNYMYVCVRGCVYVIVWMRGCVPVNLTLSIFFRKKIVVEFKVKN